MVNLDNRTFRSVSNTENGEVTADTIFEYQQEGDLISAVYSGGNILFGHLIGNCKEDDCIHIHYHHVNTEGKMMTGICVTTPQILANGKIRLYERWKWTSGDESEGESVAEEV